MLTYSGFVQESLPNQKELKWWIKTRFQFLKEVLIHGIYLSFIFYRNTSTFYSTVIFRHLVRRHPLAWKCYSLKTSRNNLILVHPNYNVIPNQFLIYLRWMTSTPKKLRVKKITDFFVTCFSGFFHRPKILDRVPCQFQSLLNICSIDDHGLYP